MVGQVQPFVRLQVPLPRGADSSGRRAWSSRRLLVGTPPPNRPSSFEPARMADVPTPQ